MRRQGPSLSPFPSPSITIIRGAPADGASCKRMLRGEPRKASRFPPRLQMRVGEGGEGGGQRTAACSGGLEALKPRL